MTEEQRWKQKYQIEVDRNKCLKGIWDELKNISERLEKIANHYNHGPYHISCDLSKDDKAYEDAIKAVQEIDGGHLTVVNDDHLDPFKLPD